MQNETPGERMTEDTEEVAGTGDTPASPAEAGEEGEVPPAPVDPDGEADAGAPEDGEAGTNASVSDTAADKPESDSENSDAAPETPASAPGDGGEGESAGEAAEAVEGEVDEEEDAEGKGGGEDPGEEVLPLASLVEALLFGAPKALTLPQLTRATGRKVRQAKVAEAIDELNRFYAESARAFEIVELSGRFQIMSRPEFAAHIASLYPKSELKAQEDKSNRLTPALLETLSIIAYRQPVTKAGLKHIRGVDCSPALRTLIERGSVKAVGKRMDLLGQPMAYGTTDAFLAEFGLASLDDLPSRGLFADAHLPENPDNPEPGAEAGFLGLHSEPSIEETREPADNADS